MTSKPVGGRGLKAPYDTAIVRVPCELLPHVNKVIADFRLKVISSEVAKTDLYYSNKEVRESMELARDILKQKKGSKQSLQKLLQLLYNTDDFVL